VATVVALASGGVEVPDTGLAVACMFGLGIISTVVSQTAFFLGVSKLGPAPAALVAASEPVMALTWLVLLLDESMRAIQVVGAALVIVGVVWSQRVRPEQAAK
jgi:drug/metabolite transporter (DMT)-like permease